MVYHFFSVMTIDSAKPKIVVLCGPTGIGKTAVGLELSEKFGGEIVGADSMQVYRHMDIGTAKPTPAERRRVAHHMVDVADPDEDFDAVLFSKQARAAIAQVIRRGRVPFVVGGTGLYIKALLHGLFQSESVDPAIRDRLKQEAAQNGGAALYERLQKIDPGTADRLHPNDSFRIIRALETVESTGKAISELHQQHGFADDPFNALKIGLQMDRPKLYERIDRRVDLMIAAGLVQEVEKLLAAGYGAELKSMQSIGYRHVVDFLTEKLTWEECVRTLKRDTRRFAKRQFTWFGADPLIQWYETDRLEEITRQVDGFLA